MIGKISNFRCTIILLSLIVLLLTVRYFASSFSNSQERTIEKPITRSAIIDTVAFRQTKIELLKVEMAQRHEGRLARENRFIQSKALFVTLLAVLLGFMPDKSTGKIKLSERIVFLIVVLSFLFYWYDVYLVDQQERNRERNRKIIEHLESIPKLKAADLDTIRIYTDLTEKNLYRKIVLVLLPKYEHIFFLSPIAILLTLGSCRELKNMVRKKGKKRKRKKDKASNS